MENKEMNKEPMAPLTESGVALSDGLLGDVAGAIITRVKSSAAAEAISGQNG